MKPMKKCCLIGVHMLLYGVWGVCWTEVCCMCVWSLSVGSPHMSLKRTVKATPSEMTPCVHEKFWYFSFSSPCLWECTHGLSIKVWCQWVKTRLCFVSDLQTSIVSGKEMSCSVLWLDFDILLQSFSVLNWQTCSPPAGWGVMGDRVPNASERMRK